MIAYATLFWPDFVVHDDCVFRHEPGDAHYSSWMEHLKGDKSRVEFVINHVHILDMFANEDFEPSEDVIMHVGKLLQDMWSCKLARDFPERPIQVEFAKGTCDDLLAYEVTFYQKR